MKVIFDKANPNTTVGVMKFKNIFQMAHVDKYNGYVTKLLDTIYFDCKKITKRKQIHNDYLMHLFDMLEIVIIPSSTHSLIMNIRLLRPIDVIQTMTQRI